MVSEFEGLLVLEPQKNLVLS